MKIPPNNSPLTEAHALGQSPADSGPNAPTADHVPRGTEPECAGRTASLTQIDGYRIDGEIARGGMGIVLAAHDLALDREVAIKVLIGAIASDLARARFVRESKIAAKLAHPCIPPVHALGTLPDGSPFLAMKRIRGETLAALLKARPSKTADLQRFLQIFEQVAQAVGFAHSQGIIHRDLKPANVMVGEFGEVQVMDWGIAKILADSESDRADRDIEAGSNETQAGAVMGTPAYLAPEQARGEAVDARADVFALGAILCVVLTGSTPFEPGSSAIDTIRRSAAGDLGAAMSALDACSADVELVALAKRCLAPRADDRPSTAREVAQAVASYRADVESRLHEAESRRAASEVRESEQRKRRLTVMAAAAVTCMVLAGGAGVSTILAFRAQDAEKATSVQLAATNKAKDAAEIFAIQAKLSSRSGTLELRKELLSSARGGLKKLLAESEKHGNPDQKLVWSYFQMGKIESELGNVENSKREFQTGHELAKRLADADPSDRDAAHDLSASLTNLGDWAKRVNDAPKALAYYQEKFEIDRRLVEAQPNDVRGLRDLSLSHGRLGEMALLQGRTKDAHEHHMQKLRIVRELTNADPQNDVLQHDLAVSYELLGNSASYLKQTALALDSYGKMNEIMLHLLDADPQNVGRLRDLSVNLNKLGNLNLDAGQTQASVGYFEKAAAILEKLAAADPQSIRTQTELFIGYDSLAFAQEQLHDYAKAVATYRKGRAVIVPLHEKKLLVGQLQNALQSTDQQILMAQRLAKAIADLDYALRQPPGEVPALLDLRLKVQAGKADLAGTAATAKAYAQFANEYPKLCYRAARAWSIASGLAKDDTALHEEYAAQAVALLRKTPTGRGESFASSSQLAAQLRQDEDLAGLRNRADFRALVKTLEETAREKQ